MVEFVLPQISKRTDGWGPPADVALDNSTLLDFSIEQLEKFPIQRIGKVCDFTLSGQRFAEQRLAKGKGKGKAQALGPVPSKDEEGFALVNHKVLTGKGTGRGRFGKGKSKGRGIADNYQEGILGQKQKPYFQATQSKGKSGGKGKGGRGGGRGGRAVPSFKEWSVATRTEWLVKREIMLPQLAKLQIDAKGVTFEDIMWCGVLQDYSKEFDRVTAKTERPLSRFEELSFFNVSTSDDPHLPELLRNDTTTTVIATDHVLACLVAAARSVYSWDIVITKISNRLLFDKRDGSQIDFLSVNETAAEPPSSDDKEHMNSPQKLSQEAACINQNFSQMVLDSRTEPQHMENPNPFQEEEGEDSSLASGAYRYRKITIPGNPKDEVEFNQQPVSLIVRTEVNAKSADGQLMSLKALNEFNPKLNYSWRTHLESQRGAVLANELKNNAFKLGRWTAQAILSGCDVMKVGYISRVHPDDPWNHSILGVQTSFTDSFAEQIGMTRNNMFGILRNIIDLVMTWEDGKYLVMKDPTKPVLRVYEVPWDTFPDDEGSDEEEEEIEEEELDEDGNVVPSVGGAVVK
mmetsp:Transcript_59825/g.110766  ORF Transcript_59825/g.110766 Transcript_59825/m.110766 type:complete len:575 (-) Transcript_59825:90-1814(-)